MKRYIRSTSNEAMREIRRNIAKKSSQKVATEIAFILEDILDDHDYQLSTVGAADVKVKGDWLQISYASKGFAHGNHTPYEFGYIAEAYELIGDEIYRGMITDTSVRSRCEEAGHIVADELAARVAAQLGIHIEYTRTTIMQIPLSEVQ